MLLPVQRTKPVAKAKGKGKDRPAKVKQLGGVLKRAMKMEKNAKK